MSPVSREAAMKVLVEPSAHHLLNMGDVAMLVAVVRRVRRVWPDAVVGVIANEAERLERHCPGVVHVPAAGRRLWFDEPYLGARLHELLPAPLARTLRRAEQQLRRTRPSVAALVIRGRRRVKREDTTELDAFLSWARTADAVVVVGAGLLNDEFASAAKTVLELLESAAERGAVTAMMGQGVGPLTDRELRAVARRVLPRVGLVCLREEREGKPILQSLGVPDDVMVTTGDDAIELAFESRGEAAEQLGLGVSIRVARYSNVSEQQLAGVGEVVRRVSAALGAEPVSVPISAYWNERDLDVIARTLGRDDLGGAPPETPEEVIARVRRCRVVVTGSYHAGVFALAQGVPAIGLAASPYYIGKFLGLADQFHGHCPVVRLDEQGFERRLERAITRAWADADRLRPELVAAAERQLRSADAALERLRALRRFQPGGSP